ncbi:ureidoglycolate lyase [Chelativorans sp. Marseille-P2723]|uniref:ureidoglycolate lyase n=1 Tax=Chelativorans sp. Marseille-P2723 TaxID=2709133 RepID=UPI00156E18AA|nr:ureidoglycolate lyase [Chelativorans sp. Marseille-P2723]
MRRIVAVPLTREAFAPFGDVIEADGAASFPINNGMTERFHDLARVEAVGEDARVLISIARGQPYALPLTLKMVERHPLGSQAFIPLSPQPFLVVVCPDEGGRPGRPLAFLTKPGQGVNYARNTWHGVLTPVDQEQDFLIVDRGGEGINLEEFFFEEPFRIDVLGHSS